VTAEGLRDTGGSETGLRIEIHERAGWVQVALIGEVDLEEADRVAHALAGAVAAAGEGVVVDLRGATFLGSTGVRMLIDAEAAARARSLPLKVAAGAGPARRTLELVGLTERLDLVEDVD
jgi:anti-sigma B factor antagonist